MYVPLQSDWKDGGHCQSRERPGGDQTTGHPPQPREQHDCSVSQKDALTVLVMFVEKGFFFLTHMLELLIIYARVGCSCLTAVSYLCNWSTLSFK